MDPISAAPLNSGMNAEEELHPATQHVQLFGHVTLVRGYEVPGYAGCHALVGLRDTPGGTVAIMTTALHLQSLLETALATGNLIGFSGYQFEDPPTPLGGTWAVDVYSIYSVILYGMK